jgi:hypothetical protein
MGHLYNKKVTHRIGEIFWLIPWKGIAGDDQRDVWVEHIACGCLDGSVVAPGVGKMMLQLLQL